jgi:acyl-CoA hydrolase
LVDDVTVRRTGAIAFAMSNLVNDRIAAQQEAVFAEVKDTPEADLDTLARLDIAPE